MPVSCPSTDAGIMHSVSQNKEGSCCGVVMVSFLGPLSRYTTRCLDFLDWSDFLCRDCRTGGVWPHRVGVSFFDVSNVEGVIGECDNDVIDPWLVGGVSFFDASNVEGVIGECDNDVIDPWLVGGVSFFDASNVEGVIGECDNDVMDTWLVGGAFSLCVLSSENR